MHAYLPGRHKTMRWQILTTHNMFETRRSKGLTEWIRRTLLFLSVLLVSALPHSAAGQQVENGIVFATLRVTSTSVDLLSADVRPGRLKRSSRAARPGRFVIETTTIDGAVLSSSVIESPLQRRLEYADPESDELKAIVIELDEQLVTVRFPFRSEASLLSLYSIETGSAGRFEQSQGQTDATSRRLLGSVSIDVSR